MLLYTDHNGFLSSSLPNDEPKTYTITAGGQLRTSSDHPVVVVHKGEIKIIARKDLGNTMQLIRLVPNNLTELNKNNDMSDKFVGAVLSVLGWYHGYDEVSNQHYYYIPKLNGQRLIDMLNELEFFVDIYSTTLIDTKKGRFTSDYNFSHQGDTDSYILAQFFGLCLVYGKPTISKDIFSAYKIQIPVLRFDIEEKVVQLVEQLRMLGFVIQLHHNPQQQIIELTTNDYDLLAYIRILYGDRITATLVDKILDLQKEIFIQYGISADQKAMRWKLLEVKR